MKKAKEYRVLRLIGADDVRLRAFENKIHAGVPSDPGDAQGEVFSVREWLGLSSDEIYVLEVTGDCMVDAQRAYRRFLFGGDYDPIFRMRPE